MRTVRIKHFIDGHRITLIAVLCLFGLCLLNATSRPDKKPEKKTGDKIFLKHADQLIYDRYGSGMGADAQIVKGNVIFESQDKKITCDSAYYYQSRQFLLAMGNVVYTAKDNLKFTCDSASYDFNDNSPVSTFRAFAFGNREVHYSKGDTLKVDCKNMTYTESSDKSSKKLEARNDVYLNHKGRTLKTDNLNYIKNIDEEKAWFYEGGLMEDGPNSISADWGMYYFDSQKAEFFYSVKMRHGKWFVMTEKMYYDSPTRTAHIVGESTIRNDEDHTIVSTNDAYFNDAKNSFELFGRSMIRNTESHMRIQADSLFYDKSLGQGEGFGRVEYVDTLRKRQMYGDYVFYDEINGANKGFGSVHVIDDGKQMEILCDTLFANNITEVNRAFGHVHLIDHGRDSEMFCDRAFTDDKNGEKEGAGNVYIIDHKRQTEMTCDSVYSNDINGDNKGFNKIIYVDKKNKNEVFGDYFLYNKDSETGLAHDNAWMKDYSQGDTLYVRADTIRLYTMNLKTDSMYREAHGYKNVRAYRKDVQAICDSLICCSRDSSMTMYQQPVAWSDNRQIRGEEIKVYMADSTVREAHVNGQAFSIEKIDDENHYNQISSDILDSYFTDGKIRRVVAIRNVHVLFYPADEKTDSLMFLNNTETDTLRMYLSEERKLQRIWTSKHKSALYPMTQIPPDKYKLQGFQLLDDLRPKDWKDIFNVKQMSAEQQQNIISRPKMPLNTFGGDDNMPMTRKEDEALPKEDEIVTGKEDEEVTNE